MSAAFFVLCFGAGVLLRVQGICIFFEYYFILRMESRKASCFLGKHKSGIHLMEDMLSTWGRRRRSTIMKKAMKKMIMAGALCVAGAALIAGCGDSGSSAGGGKQFLNIATGGKIGRAHV